MGGTDTTSLTALESSPCAGCVTSVEFTTSLGLSLPLKDVNQRTSDKRRLLSVVGGGFTRMEGCPGPSVNAPVGRAEAAGSRGWTSGYKTTGVCLSTSPEQKYKDVEPSLKIKEVDGLELVRKFSGDMETMLRRKVAAIQVLRPAGWGSARPGHRTPSLSPPTPPSPAS